MTDGKNPYSAYMGSDSKAQEVQHDRDMQEGSSRHSDHTSEPLPPPYEISTAGHLSTSTSPSDALLYTGNRPGMPSTYNPLSPPPPSFTRTFSSSVARPPAFRPIILPAQKRYSLAEGFEPLLPSDIQVLSPRDILPPDISRFLSDIHVIGHGPGSDTTIGAKLAHTAPVARHIPIVGLIVNKVVHHTLVAPKVKQDVVPYVEAWNDKFFRQRGIDCWIRIGGRRVSGSAAEKERSTKYFHAGAAAGVDSTHRRHDDDDSSSSSSSSDDEDDQHGGRGRGRGVRGRGRGRAERREDRAERREERAKRRAERRAFRAERRREKGKQRSERSEQQEQYKDKIYLIFEALP